MGNIEENNLLKYIIFYLLWLVIWYFILGFFKDSFNPLTWDEFTKTYFILDGIFLGLILTAMWFIDDHWKLN